MVTLRADTDTAADDGEQAASDVVGGTLHPVISKGLQQQPQAL